MLRIQWTGVSSIGMILAMLVVACTVDDNDDPVFSCDARTVADYCVQEPASMATQEASKGTCQSVPGTTWSDSKGCPSGYKKKCPDGDKTYYYYAANDAGKSCSELVAILPQGSERLAMSWEPAIPLP